MAEHLGVLAEHPLDQVAGETRTSSPARTRTYSMSSPTASAALEISVHGVVVQATSESPGSTAGSGIASEGGASVTGKRT